MNVIAKADHTHRLTIWETRLEIAISLKDYKAAWELIKEVLDSELLNSSGMEMDEWRRRLISKVELELILFSLKNDNKHFYNRIDIEKEVDRIIDGKSELEICEEIGLAVPNATRELLSLLNKQSSNQLTSKTLLVLPEQEAKEKNSKVGKTVFDSIKKVLYNSLCSPESEIYKTWFNNGMKVFLSKECIGAAVISCLVKLEIGIQLLAAPLIALIMKFGIEVFCEKCRPAD